MMSLAPRNRSIAILALTIAAACAGGTARAGNPPVVPPPAAGFIVNQGQIDPQVLYYAVGPNAAIYFTRTSVVIDRWRTEARPLVAKRPGADLAPPTRRHGRAVAIRFDGARDPSAVEGVGQLPARASFFYGNDPAGWRADVPAFARVVYHDVWPGLDLDFSIEDGRIRCTPEARDGADPNVARFTYEGLGDGTDGWDAGIDPQPTSGGSADRDDPSRLLWSTFLGGTSEEIAWSVAVDGQGQPVVCGVTFSVAFPTTPGAYDRTYQGLGDVFVSKLSADGSQLIWSTFLGGTAMNFDYGYSVALDPLGNPFVTGYTWSSDFPTTAGAYDRSFNGGVDAFVSHLSANGSTLLWSTFLGGVDHDIAYAIATDSEGNPIVTGRTLSPDFPTTPGAYDTTPNGEEDVFVSALTSTGNILTWSTLIGGSAYDGASAVRVDTDGSPIVAGYTASGDFPGGGFAGGLYDGFACRLRPDGSALLWTRLFGGFGADYGNALVLDSAGNPLICGETGSPDFPVTPGAYDTSYNGDDDAYVIKLGHAAGEILWATFLGGTVPFYETAFGIARDGADQPTVVGSTPAPDFPTTPDAYDRSHNGASDVWVARLDASGAALEWSSFLGGSGDDYGFDVALAGGGQAIVVGVAGDATFPSTAGSYDPSYNGDVSDVFVADLLVDRDPAGIHEPAGGNAAGLSVQPNPIRSGARIAYTLAVPANVVAEIADVEGRVVRRIACGEQLAGAHGIEWDGRGDAGRILPAGRYFARVRADGFDRVVPIAIVR